MKKFLLLIVGLCLMGLVSSGYAYTGNQLLRDCEETDTFGHGYCLGYINGIANIYPIYIYSDTKQADCWHNYYKEVTLGQQKKVLIKYLKDNPEELHESAGILVISTFIKAFPMPEVCKTKK